MLGMTLRLDLSLQHLYCQVKKRDSLTNPQVFILTQSAFNDAVRAAGKHSVWKFRSYRLGRDCLEYISDPDSNLQLCCVSCCCLTLSECKDQTKAHPRHAMHWYLFAGPARRRGGGGGRETEKGHGWTFSKDQQQGSSSEGFCGVNFKPMSSH